MSRLKSRKPGQGTSRPSLRIERLPKLSALWEAELFPEVAAELTKALRLPRGSHVTPLDVFVVRYAADAQKELAVHRDNGLLTFSLLLKGGQVMRGHTRPLVSTSSVPEASAMKDGACSLICKQIVEPRAAPNTKYQDGAWDQKTADAEPIYYDLLAIY